MAFWVWGPAQAGLPSWIPIQSCGVVEKWKLKWRELPTACRLPWLCGLLTRPSLRACRSVSTHTEAQSLLMRAPHARSHACMQPR